MRMYDIIVKKKRGEVLTDGEIKFFVDGYTAGEIPDYQAAAFCMAVCFNGMTDEEAAQFTYHMMHSGDVIDLSSLTNTADKHSTGGVGDKTSLIVAPTAASLGLSVAKMSGRGLGHTGGTIDKLESIPGFRTSLTNGEFMDQVRRIGVAIVSQTGNLAPADKKLYSLRDVTATVDSLPLIASSIMSKKLASGAESIVLDVKYGSGAFMKTPEDAAHLAEVMVNIGKSNNRRVCALITDMDKPLGQNIGNSLEVIEAVDVLRGDKRGELYEISAALTANMLALSTGIGVEEADIKVRDAIDSGKAYEKFLEWIAAQGGDVSYITENKLSLGEKTCVITAEQDGFISHIDAEGIGQTACILGAGRLTKDDSPDLSAGIVLEKNVGDMVRKGDVIARMYTSSDEKLNPSRDKMIACIEYSTEKPQKNPLVNRIVY